MQINDANLDEHIPGAVNLRDLGGYTAGAARVRRGLVFRSGMTHGITPEGLDWLATKYRIRTIVDLRSDDELRRDGVVRCEDYGITREHVPVYGVTAFTPDMQQRRFRAMAQREYDWCARYQVLVKDHPESFVRFVRTLAAPGALPAIFHCSAGRDRTGIAAALLLGVLGVGTADIEADYASTGAYLARHLGRYARLRARMAFTDQQMHAVFQTEAVDMRRFMAWLYAEYGGPAAFLLSHGLASAQIEALRSRLLT